MDQRRELLIPRDWLALDCNQRRLYRIPEEPFTLCYREDRNLFLFFVFREQIERWCPFVEKFVQRFFILLSFTRYEVDIPFPAVLEFQTQ